MKPEFSAVEFRVTATPITIRQIKSSRLSSVLARALRTFIYTHTILDTIVCQSIKKGGLLLPAIGVENWVLTP
jgi:hypothetical protein